ncbi:MAG TPA: S8 family serine peptidase, partial [Gammaproteobacteria bacterium]|nr:S8 family serine peptidase [Gammaproteobacteria bacterium]
DELLDVAIARGAIVVAAQPGPGSPADSFPSSHRDVLVARASSQRTAPASPYSLPAPANEILTTVPDRGYAFLSGTSFAAAQVSGIVALLMQQRPGLEVQQAASLLRSTTVRSEGDESVNACRALEKLMARRFCSRSFTGTRGEDAGRALAQASARAETVR